MPCPQAFLSVSSCCTLPLCYFTDHGACILPVVQTPSAVVLHRYLPSPLRCALHSLMLHFAADTANHLLTQLTQTLKVDTRSTVCHKHDVSIRITTLVKMMSNRIKQSQTHIRHRHPCCMPSGFEAKIFGVSTACLHTAIVFAAAVHHSCYSGRWKQKAITSVM